MYIKVNILRVAATLLLLFLYARICKNSCFINAHSSVCRVTAKNRSVEILTTYKS